MVEEQQESRSQHLLLGCILSFLPFFLTVTNSLALRYAGMGIQGELGLVMIQPVWLLFGLLFPLWILPFSKGSSYLKTFAFFSVCLIVAISGILFPLLVSQLSGALMMLGGVLFLVIREINVIAVVLVTSGVSLILSREVNRYSLLRIVVLVILYAVLYRHFSGIQTDWLDGNSEREAAFVFLLGTLLSIEVVRIQNDYTRVRVLILELLAVILALVAILFWNNFAEKNTLKGGQRVSEKRSIELSLTALKKLSTPEGLKKLKVYLMSSPYWKVKRDSPFEAVIREEKGDILVEKNKFSISGASSRVLTSIVIDEREKNDPGRSMQFELEQYQDVQASAPSVDVLIFDSKFHSITKKKEIHLQIQEGPIALRISETSEADHGHMLQKTIEDLKKRFSTMLDLDEQAIRESQAVQGGEVGKCYYYPPLQSSSVEIWGYVNGGEPGSVSAAINGVARSYSGEWIGWSEDKQEGFYFEDAVYSSSDQGEVESVELRFYPDSKNKSYSRSNYSVIATCQKR